MRAIEIARRMAELGQTQDACGAYILAIDENKGQNPAEDMEAAVYLLQTSREGGDYRPAFGCFLDLYRGGHFREDCLSILTEAFYLPNEKGLRSRYERNCKLLRKYPYLFRKDFPAFEELTLRFYPFDEKTYVPFDMGSGEFLEAVRPGHPVISRNFFKDLEKPVLAADVFSQYELEYLNDNVRKSEWVGRENHVYLHYTDWKIFCSWLQILNIRPLLKDEKPVFLIGDEIARYPIDFKAEFGIDYSRFPIRPVGIREINKLILHTQLSAHNGGDFFNEILDAHPNLLTAPSILIEDIKKDIETLKNGLEESNSVKDAGLRLSAWDERLGKELYLLSDRTEKDILAANYLRNTLHVEKEDNMWLDKASRIAPAVLVQPHFANMKHDFTINPNGETTVDSDDYEEICNSQFLRGFKYIKTFTPLRRITTSYGATVKFMHKKVYEKREDNEAMVIPNAIFERILNRSFMVDWQDRLFQDCVLVRFEDGKLNPKATFTALAEFLDIPYTESMTYCSMDNKRNPESLKGNDRGFSLDAVYRSYDDYANDDERYFLEFFTRDVYEHYGYDFHYYDGQPVDEAKAEELIDKFTTLDHYIRESWWRNIFSVMSVARADGGEMPPEEIEEFRHNSLEEKMKQFRNIRLENSKQLLRGLHFVNKNGQPLHMMPMLKLDPELLERPLYR